MMSEWEKLVDLIEDSVDGAIYNADAPQCLAGIVANYAATALLAAGYRKPRTITTAEELDALGEGAVIRDSGKPALERVGSLWYATGELYFVKVILPATVLWEPSA